MRQRFLGNRACRDLRRFAVICVGCSGADLGGEPTDGARDQENKGRSESKGGTGGAERCEFGKEREWEESCAQGRSGAGIEVGTVKMREMKGARIGQELGAPGNSGRDGIEPWNSSPRTPKRLQLSWALASSLACPQQRRRLEARQGQRPVGKGIQMRPVLKRTPPPRPHVKRIVAGLDRGACRVVFALASKRGQCGLRGGLCGPKRAVTLS